MASISTSPNGRRTVQFIAGDKKRRSIRLGRVSMKIAEAVKGRVEILNAARMAGHPPDVETSRWLGELDDMLYGKLAAVGLAPEREKPVKKAAEILGPFLDDYTTKRVDVKPATREVWGQVVRNLKEHFGADRELITINEGHADDFKLYLIGEGLATTTVHKRLQFARMFFRAAKRRKLIPANPFAEVSASAAIDESRQRFITADETRRILAVCNPTWQTIVALCRYGGLRCPSEVLSLRWQDVGWASGKLVVRSPKTEHHPGKATRTIPIFPELRPHLEAARQLSPKDAEYVVGGGYREASLTPSGWRNCNLRTQFERLIKRAGLTPWPRLFHALRASRETELAQTFPLHVVTAWLGNTPRIAMKHYLQVTDDDFAKALASGAKSGAESGAVAVQNPVQQPAAAVRTESQSLPEESSTEGVIAAACESMLDGALLRNGEDRNHDLASRGTAPFAANPYIIRAFRHSSTVRPPHDLRSLSRPRATKAPQNSRAILSNAESSDFRRGSKRFRLTLFTNRIMPRCAGPPGASAKEVVG